MVAVCRAPSLVGVAADRDNGSHSMIEQRGGVSPECGVWWSYICHGAHL